MHQVNLYLRGSWLTCHSPVFAVTLQRIAAITSCNPSRVWISSSPLAFAQLTARESLRDIELNLRAQSAKLYHVDFRCKPISRYTLDHANATRPWQIYASFAQHLIGIARPLYANGPLAFDLRRRGASAVV